MIETNWDDYPLVEPIKRTPKWPEWHQEAACKGTEESVFFGEKNPHTRPALNLRQIKNAKVICKECPVFDKCLKHAITQHEEYGIWAGTTGRARERIWAKIRNGEKTAEQVISDYLAGNIQQYEGYRSLSGY